MEAMITFLKQSISVSQINLLPYHNIAGGKYDKLDIRYKGEAFTIPPKEQMEAFQRQFIQMDLQIQNRRLIMRRGMNERIQKLREQSVNAVPHIYMERADLETDAYIKYEGSVSVPEMRALAFKHFMENKTLCINEGELIVGEKGDSPQSAPTFPELCCHTLEDMHVMNDRDLISFKVTEEDLKLQEERSFHTGRIVLSVIRSFTI